MSDDLFAVVHARPKRRQGITGQTIDAQMRGTMCQITEWELEELSDEIARLRAEVDRLTQERDEAVAKAGAMRACAASETAKAASLRTALADERRHADELAERLGRCLRFMEGTENELAITLESSEQGRAIIAAHRARRQG